MNHPIYQQYRLLEEGKSFVSCVIIRTEGSTPRKAGAHMMVVADGTVFGTIGGGAIEAEVIRDAQSLMGKQQPLLKSYILEHDLEMLCGGQVQVFMEPFGSIPKLVIFGAGHVGQAVASLAQDIGFSVKLMDEREEILNAINLPGIDKIHGLYDKLAQDLQPDPDTYVLITTHEHSKDEMVLGLLGSNQLAYLGMIASQRKAARVRENLLNGNILAPEQIDNVDMPVGIKIASETPKEIAISIVAKLIDVKNTR